nr:SDR family oxidoreductase [uncultured Hyphomonas sp.]
MKALRILLTGSTGSIGASILKNLTQNYNASDLYLTVRGDARPNIDSNDPPRARIHYIEADFELGDFGAIPKDIDVLINCAGVPSGKNRFHDISDDEYNWVMSVNATAPFKLCRIVLPHMVSQKFGRIVNVNSIWGERGSEKNGAYHMSKHALRGLTRAIAKEYARFGVTCNDVSPGAVSSAMIQRIARRMAEQDNSSEELVISSFNEAQVRGSMIEPEEVSAAVMFLISEAASGVNGQSLVVDGGMIC